MLIPNINASVASAAQPPRLTSDSAPAFVAANNSNTEVASTTPADMVKLQNDNFNTKAAESLPVLIRLMVVKVVGS